MASRPGLDAAQIISAAAELADIVGLHQFTLKELADKLGVRPPSLYNHVSSLDAVHRGLTLRALLELAHRMRASAVGLTGLDALRGVAHAERSYAREHPGLFESVQRTVEDQDEELRLAAHALLDIMLAVLRGYSLEGEVGIHAARAFRAALTGFVLLETRHGFGLPTAVDQSFEWLIVMLDAGLRASRTPEPLSASQGPEKAG
jgi:AcrR family transcriptional regulator